jgi:hypothetical protein
MRLIALALIVFASQEGPVELFNGKDLSGWTVMNKAEWAVEEGLLTLTGKGGNGWLRSEKKYKDFELSVDWKTTADKYDSGIFFRALEPGDPWPKTAFQINLLKGREGQGAGLKDAPGKPDLIKAGDWNQFVLRVQGKGVKLSINGKDAWTAEEPSMREGFIGLQAEGVRFQFRNIRLATLKPE